VNLDIVLLFLQWHCQTRSVLLLRPLWLSRERKSLSIQVPVAVWPFSAVTSTRTLRELSLCSQSVTGSLLASTTWHDRWGSAPRAVPVYGSGSELMNDRDTTRSHRSLPGFQLEMTRTFSKAIHTYTTLNFYSKRNILSRQQDYLLYTTILCGHIYSISQLYTNYHIFYHFFPHFFISCSCLTGECTIYSVGGHLLWIWSSSVRCSV
jgi:hypothetical protein